MVREIVSRLQISQLEGVKLTHMGSFWSLQPHVMCLFWPGSRIESLNYFNYYYFFFASNQLHQESYDFCRPRWWLEGVYRKEWRCTREGMAVVLLPLFSPLSPFSFWSLSTLLQPMLYLSFLLSGVTPPFLWNFVFLSSTFIPRTSQNIFPIRTNLL